MSDEILGMTIEAAADPKDKLLERQKARARSSGIAPKDGGSLTMPKKWRGVVPDSNDSWGDWTNYAFPIHDVAHANNAAARLAQNSSYSSEEKAKIHARIEKAQKKHGAKKFAKGDLLELEAMTLVTDGHDFLEDPNKPADNEPASSEEDLNATYSKKEVKDMMVKMAEQIYGMYNQMYSNLYGQINQVYSIAMKRDSDIVKGINGCMEDHGDGHMPKMQPHHVEAILKAAKIHGDFEKEKIPMEHKHNHLYASISEADKKTLDSLKIKVN